LQCVRPSPHSPIPVPQQQYAIASFLSRLLSRADLPSSTHGPGSHDSFNQYPTANGSAIIAKPLKQPLVNTQVYEDYLHVVVACLLALALIVLLGLIIRHYGLTLPSLTHFQRSKRPRSPAGDAESSPRSDTRRGVTGLGFEELEEKAAGGGGLEDAIAYCCWGTGIGE